MDLGRILLAAPSPFADPVVRLDLEHAPPPDVATVHGPVRIAIADAIAIVGRDRRAQMVLVTGDPGMGKTHQLAHLRRRAEGAYVCVDVPPLKDGAPFAHLARYAVQGLAAAGVLERMLWDTLRQVAAAVRLDAEDHGDDDVVARIDDVLVGGDRFSMAFRSLAQQDAELGPLLYKRGRRLAPLSVLPADFGRVLCRITDREAERAIIDWLRAAELAAEDLALLGLERGVDDESRAFEVVRALCLTSQRPIVLCLDQIESISGIVGAAGVARLFTALMELYQQAPVAIVLMCQTQQWVELRRDVPQAAVDRIRVLPPLAKPTVDEAVAIIGSRLAGLWHAAHAAPPYPTWPFAPSFVRALVEQRRPTIRQLMLEIDAHLGDMRRTDEVQERLGDPLPPVATAAGTGPTHAGTQPIPTVVVIPPPLPPPPTPPSSGPPPIPTGPSTSSTSATPPPTPSSGPPPIPTGPPPIPPPRAPTSDPGSAPVPRPSVATSSSGPFAAQASDPRVALKQARDRYLRAASERKDLATPAFREELLRHALMEVLQGARSHGLVIAAARVALVSQPERPRHGPRAPMLLTLETSGGPRRLAVELHSGPAQATVRVLGRLCDMVDERGADCAVLLRERAAPLPDSARRSQELVSELSQRGGAVVWLEEDDAVRLVGAGLLLDAAGAAEVLIGERQATREEVLTYLLREDRLADLLGPMISRGTSTPPRLSRMT